MKFIKQFSVDVWRTAQAGFSWWGPPEARAPWAPLNPALGQPSLEIHSNRPTCSHYRKTVMWLKLASHLGNANPGGIFQTRVYGFGGLQTRVPGYQGLM